MSTSGGSFGTNSGATEATILAAEGGTGFKFPESYRKFISNSDGGFFKEQALRVLSLKESLEYFENIRRFGLIQAWGCFPILDNDDSNPWCICCKQPLDGYIVQVMHDDAAQIKFRSIDTFFSAIQAGDGDDPCFMDDLEGDFRSKVRSERDIIVGLELLKMAPNFDEHDRSDACRFAMWLLNEEHIDQIAPLLDDEDAYVARDAADRLAAMNSPKAKAAIQTNQKNFAAFVEKSQFLLEGASIQGSIENGNIIRLGPASILLDMKTFYARKKEPDAENKFLERVKSLIAER